MSSFKEALLKPLICAKPILVDRLTASDSSEMTASSPSRLASFHGDVAFCQSRRLLATANSDKKEIRVYRYLSGNWVLAKKGRFDAYSRGLCWSGDGSRLAWIEQTKSGDREAVWDFNRLIRFSDSHGGFTPSVVEGICLSNSGKSIAIARNNGADVYTIGLGRTRSYELDQSPLVSVAFSPHDDLVAAGRSVIAVSARGSRATTSLRHDYIGSLACNKRQSSFLALTFEPKLTLNLLPGSAPYKTVWHGSGYPAGVAWSPNGKYAAVCLVSKKGTGSSQSNRIVVFATKEWRIIRTIRLGANDAGDLQFDFSSSILSASVHQETILWSVPSGERAPLALTNK